MRRRISLLLMLLLILPVSAQAQGSSQRDEMFCTARTDHQAAIAESFASRTEAYDKAIEQQADNRAARLNRLDEALGASRAKADIRRAEVYQLIKDKQDTAENKALADGYAGEVDEAVRVRREAYDGARATFRSKVGQALAARDENMRTGIDTFRSAADEAMQAAAVQCGSSRSDSAAIRRQFIDDLQSARLTYADHLRARSDFGAEVREAIEARNEAYDAATQQFQRSMQTIREKYAELRR